MIKTNRSKIGYEYPGFVFPINFGEYFTGSYEEKEGQKYRGQELRLKIIKGELPVSVPGAEDLNLVLF